MLPVRDGPLAIDPQTDGPLQVRGNMEIISGTGRVVARARVRAAVPLRRAATPSRSATAATRIGVGFQSCGYGIPDVALATRGLPLCTRERVRFDRALQDRDHGVARPHTVDGNTICDSRQPSAPSLLSSRPLRRSRPGRCRSCTATGWSCIRSCSCGSPGIAPKNFRARRIVARARSESSGKCNATFTSVTSRAKSCAPVAITRRTSCVYASIAAFAACIVPVLSSHAARGRRRRRRRPPRARRPVHPARRSPLLPRARAWTPGALKSRLLKCQNGPFRRTNFSIAHRGAPLQFPEHTKEAYEAGARMGAGIVECDVTFTKDGQLVCRHDECDLHTTTNIVEHAAQRELHGAVVGRQLQPALLRQRHHAGAVQDAQGQDGCVESGRDHGRGLSRRHGHLAHGSVHQPRHAAHAARRASRSTSGSASSTRRSSRPAIRRASTRCSAARRTTRRR